MKKTVLFSENLSLDKNFHGDLTSKFKRKYPKSINNVSGKIKIEKTIFLFIWPKPAGIHLGPAGLGPFSFFFLSRC
jgi:hypothetical protein